MKKNLLSGILVTGVIMVATFGANAQLSTPGAGVATNASGACSGCVGIGTTKPSQTLQVNGHLFIEKGLMSIFDSDYGLQFSGVKKILSPETEASNTYFGRANIDKFYLVPSGEGVNSKLTLWRYYQAGGYTKAAVYFDSKANTVFPDGKVGIGDMTEIAFATAMACTTTNCIPLKLLVNGTIGAKEIRVSTTTWADYVFNKDYKLKSLKEVDAYIQANKRLPEVPSEKEVVENGVAMGEMMKIHMKKIEELTLYMIELQKQNEKLAAEVAGLKK